MCFTERVDGEGRQHKCYLIDLAEAAPAQQVQQQVPLIQSRMVFKPVWRVHKII